MQNILKWIRPVVGPQKIEEVQSGTLENNEMQAKVLPLIAG
jgi:hypothetical protein